MRAWIKFGLCLCCWVCGAGLGAQLAVWSWVKQAGDQDFQKGLDIALDAQGSELVTGIFKGSATFGATTLNSAGDTDIFIAKLDSAGNWLWAVKAGGTGADWGHGIAVDAEGNVLVTGNFTGTATIGLAIITSAGVDDIFVSKLSSSGNWIWTRRAGGPNSDNGNSIDTDSNGNVYLSGNFSGTAAFGSTNLTTAGSLDLFAAKLNTTGSWQWAVSAGGTGNDRGNSIVTDSGGNSYLTGNIYGDSSFGDILLHGNFHDIFAAKLDSAGNWLWAKKAGSAGGDWGYGIAIDGSGNAFLTGFFEDSAAFGAATVVSAGSMDIFVAKISSTGVWQWVRRAGGSQYDQGNAIDVDSSGRISVTGFFTGSAGFGSASLTSAGDDDIFVGRMSGNGVWQWAKRAGGADEDWGYGIVTDAKSYVRLTGHFRNTADFDDLILEGAGVTTQPDIFVGKITARPLQPTNLSISRSGYDNLQLDWDDVTHDTFNNSISGVYYLIHLIPDEPYNPFYYLYGEGGTVTASELWFEGGASFAKRFFRIVAAMGD